MEIVQSRNFGAELSEHHRQIAALAEDVDTKPRLIGQGIREVTGTGSHQIIQKPVAAVHQIQRYHFGLIGRQPLDKRIEEDRHQLSALLDLQRLVHGDVQVGNLLASTERPAGSLPHPEHHCQNVIQFNAAHGISGVSIYSSSSGGVARKGRNFFLSRHLS